MTGTPVPRGARLCPTSTTSRPPASKMRGASATMRLTRSSPSLPPASAMRRLPPVFGRQLSHDRLAHVRRVRHDQIVAAPAERAEKVRARSSFMRVARAGSPRRCGARPRARRLKYPLRRRAHRERTAPRRIARHPEPVHRSRTRRTVRLGAIHGRRARRATARRCRSAARCTRSST